MPEELDTRTSSIELTRNAKGDYQWNIKIYFDKDKDKIPESILLQIEAIDKELRVKYKA